MVAIEPALDWQRIMAKRPGECNLRAASDTTLCMRKDDAMGKSTHERFLEKVQVNPDTGCWEWMGSKNFKGYGYMWGGVEVGKKIAVHRFSHEHYNGPIPDGMVVAHTCDVRNCCNPEHLVLMTYQENMDDRSEKGRAGHFRVGDEVKVGTDIQPPDRYEVFMDKIHINTETGCWEWIGFTNRIGYGVTSLKGKQIRTHRLSWVLHFGPIPPGEGHHGTVVRHKCDVRNCCNPYHLELGSHKDNMADAARRNRMSRLFGEAGPSSVLTEQQVRLIKEFLDRWPPRPGGKGIGAGSCRFAARWFGVNVMTIVNINTGKTWRHL